MTDLTPEALAALDREATQDWLYSAFLKSRLIPGSKDRWHCIEDSAENAIGEFYGENAEADAKLAAAIVEAYRAGKLVHVDAPRIATAEMVEKVAAEMMNTPERDTGPYNWAFVPVGAKMRWRAKARAALRALGYEVRE